MKATGIVRKVDELGRIVLPIELRRTLDIEEKDSLEIYMDDILRQCLWRFLWTAPPSSSRSTNLPASSAAMPPMSPPIRAKTSAPIAVRSWPRADAH